MNLSQKMSAIAEQQGEAEDYPQVKRWNNWINRENTTPSRHK